MEALVKILGGMLIGWHTAGWRMSTARSLFWCLCLASAWHVLVGLVFWVGQR